MKTSLIVVDAQKDFMKGGSLAVKDGDEIVPKINELLQKFNMVIFTQDWHLPNMDAFASQHEGKKPFDAYVNSDGDNDLYWPDHCVMNTAGSQLHDGINLNNISGDFYFFKKGNKVDYHPYSAFGGTELAEFLRDKGIERVFICGLATDFCVADTAIDSTMEGFETIVIKDATKPINENITPTLEKFYDAGVNVIDSWEVGLFLLK